MRRLGFVAVVGVVACHAPAAPPATPVRPMHALFVGSSVTYKHFIPGIVGALAAAAGERPFAYDWVIKGGTILDVLWPDAEPVIARGGWDVVALQDRNVELLEQPDRARQVAQRYGERIRAVGARGVYYQKYEFRNEPGTQARMDDATVAATSAAGLTVAWIGRAWDRVRRAHPELALFEDDMHPTPTGAYLIGCVFYATIYGKSPVGLPATVDAAGPGGKPGERVSVAPDVARMLQEAAASAARP